MYTNNQLTTRKQKQITQVLHTQSVTSHTHSV